MKNLTELHLRIFYIMNRNEIKDKLQGIIIDILENENISIYDELLLKDLNGWSSLSNAMFISAVEMEFDLRFKLADLMRISYVKDVIDLIISKNQFQYGT